MTVAPITEPATGRAMEVSTIEQYVQFYPGVSLDGSQIGKSGNGYASYAGFCLE